MFYSFYYTIFFFWGQVEHKNEIVPVYTLDAEFTRPLWVFGISSYDFIENNTEGYNIVTTYRFVLILFSNFYLRLVHHLGINI